MLGDRLVQDVGTCGLDLNSHQAEAAWSAMTKIDQGIACGPAHGSLFHIVPA